MYDINNKILPKNEYRQKIFDEFIHFGYTKARIREYSDLRECDIANFGHMKYKNTDIKSELENLLIALSVQSFFKNINLSFCVIGKGKGMFLGERLEYFICRLFSDAVKNSYNREIFLKVKLSNKKIRLTIKYIGKPIKNLSNTVYMFSANKNVFINYWENFFPLESITQKPKEAYEWISDRLSDVNLSLIDL
jgi:hypothetical protein